MRALGEAGKYVQVTLIGLLLTMALKRFVPGDGIRTERVPVRFAVQCVVPRRLHELAHAAKYSLPGRLGILVAAPQVRSTARSERDRPFPSIMGTSVSLKSQVSLRSWAFTRSRINSDC